ncbi:Peptidase family M23 [Geodermatophilus telluris]|uniref:Peptidase family M23 n=1 Tax=Geodermatophilus telluris TaxID=1190417 RepID=A0A1G6HVT6_9ACTN|nr:M23 family metallopeptidase [Geodermatophilus telluris]SDB98372.1 Peptidase family M23 [Geodermatophilus telluris]
MPARALPAVLLVLAALLLPAPAVARPAAAVGPLWTSPLGDPPEVTRPFAPPPSPYGPGHRGADLAGAPGAVVGAAGDGVVVFAGMVAGRPVVSVDHAEGLRTTYEPVAPVVAAGQAVARGAPLGTLVGGHDGCPVAACLHWGLRRGGVYLDPLSLLRPPEVRLLPAGSGAARGSSRADGGP